MRQSKVCGYCGKEIKATGHSHERDGKFYCSLGCRCCHDDEREERKLLAGMAMAALIPLCTQLQENSRNMIYAQGTTLPEHAAKISYDYAEAQIAEGRRRDKEQEASDAS